MRTPMAMGAVLAAVAVAMLVLIACSSKVLESSAPVEALPDYAYRSADAVRGYETAVREKEMLARLPCYCGCSADPQYKSLVDCFFDDQGGFRSHAANCQVCLEEAESAAGWKAEGLPLKEIRARIDTDYQGRGKGTETPPVQE